jgi:hypothetical protein
VTKNCTETEEQDLWGEIQVDPDADWRTRLKGRMHDLGRSVGFALFTEDLIKGWIEELDQAVKGIKELLTAEYLSRTARHRAVTSETDQYHELIRLEQFTATLKSSVESLHRREQTQLNQTQVEDWALALQPPPGYQELANWDLIEDTKISLRCSLRHPSWVRKCRLDVVYTKGDTCTHSWTWDEITSHLVHCSLNPPFETCADSPRMSCFVKQPTDTYRVANLLDQEPDLFEVHEWKRDLVYGLVHWSLILWDTSWFERLCTFRLEIDDPVFLSGECTLPSHGNHGQSRLRALGITLTEIMLGIQLDRAENTGTLMQWNKEKNKWVPTDTGRLGNDILAKTASIALATAIKFCLQDESALETTQWKPGYLYRAMDKIYLGYV